MGEFFYIADVRPSFQANPYITFWRPENAGYCYPLSWAGRYTRDTVEEDFRYYTKTVTPNGRKLSRFAVPCDVVDEVAGNPAPGIIDGNAGPVVRNNKRLRDLLVRSRLKIGEPT